ncbi:DivIVA domain-containing protein [Paraoerskovia sediminicola]|uniref:DivIVA domain-containing protein n=1 Tax=Paraoerskovia sediminicola TaxID=1138587 RepID=A0ABN6XGM6_9CELL|nr:DivIVA domain-containing protein [Paraoerskovia sediminicola]BDZ43930.1 DivIVA domain-containing protein [Paraoerskovia sediminicola]
MSTSLFSTTKRGQGYEPDEVDEFFDRARALYEGREERSLTSTEIQNSTFGLVRGGYNTHEVDEALDRLEGAFIARQRTAYVAAHGQQAWLEALAERARTLYPRLGRPDGEKFAPAERGEPAYDTDDVDDLCDRLVDYFDSQVPLTTREIRDTVFRRRRGGSGYAEGPVDAFFARAVEVLLGVE